MILEAYKAYKQYVLNPSRRNKRKFWEILTNVHSFNQGQPWYKGYQDDYEDYYGTEEDYEINSFEDEEGDYEF